MLTQEVWMDIKVLHQEGHSIRQIARLTGHSRNSVRAALRERTPSPFQQPERGSKLDPFKAYVLRRFAEHRLSAVRLLEEIRAMGYSGSIDILQRYIKSLRSAQACQAKATVRFETPPGAQAQADWAYCGKLGGKSVYAFVMVLGFSRMLFVEFTFSMDLPVMLECHKRAFASFGGWTESILYDNMKQVRLGPDEFNPLLLDFAGHYGFTVKTHRVRRPRTKGKVERSVDYVKDSFVLGREFVDLADMNAQGRHWLEHTANVRVHATTGERPVDLLPKEKLAALASIAPYPVAAYVSRRVNAESFVHFAGSRYSVPPEHVGKNVVLVHLGAKVVVRAGDLVIAEHDAARKPGSCMADRDHVAQLWKLTTMTETSRQPEWNHAAQAVVETRPLSVYEEAAA
jgi:transposase